MTLDEAIEKELWKVTEQDNAANSFHRICEMQLENACKKEAEEHRQLAEWLKELKRLKERTDFPNKNDGDLISRQSVLETQAKYAEHMGATKFWQMRDDIKALPPVTPQYTDAEIQKMQELEQAQLEKAYELGKAEVQPCGDCISRQAAIDAVETIGFDFSDSDLSEMELEEVCEAIGEVRQTWLQRIKRVPSVESEKCSDCISRQAVLDIAKSSKSNWIDNSVLFKRVNELPLVTPQPKIGRWIRRNSFLVPYKCSECNYESERYDNYCPNCGARMIESQEGEDKV